MSCMSQNFRLFHVSNLSVRNFRIFLLMYTGTVSHVMVRAANYGGWESSLRLQVVTQIPGAASSRWKRLQILSTLVAG